MLKGLLLATFMGTLDTFIVNVAVPSIETNLHASFAEIQLVIAGYILAFAVVLATGGRLGDLYGRKRLFQLGVVGFTLFSLFCGLAVMASHFPGKQVASVFYRKVIKDASGKKQRLSDFRHEFKYRQPARPSSAFN
jgi:MFS family permease